MEDTPVSTHDIRNYNDEIELISYVSTYHFLKYRVEYDSEAHQIQEQFEDYCDNLDALEGESWLSCMEMLFGGATVNTYNHEHIVDQVLQFAGFSLEHVGYVDQRDPRPEDHEFQLGERIVQAVEDIHGDFVALQIHNGCDVRGGYTSPTVFRATHGVDYLIMSPGTDVSCTECGWVAAQRDHHKEGAWDELEYREEPDLIFHTECGSECTVRSMVQI
jgi:hypothetical protein